MSELRKAQAELKEKHRELSRAKYMLAMFVHGVRDAQTVKEAADYLNESAFDIYIVRTA